MGKQRVLLLDLEFGIHHLAVAGILGPNDRLELQRAVEMGTAAGATLIELVGPINGLSVEDTAGAVFDGGMKNVAVCEFFGTDGSMGDPLALDHSFTTALDTIKRRFDFIAGLRACGIKVTTMTGPTWGRLGYDYGLQQAVIDDRLDRWYGRVAGLARDADVKVAVEALRYPQEDHVLKGTARLKALIRRLNDPSIGGHYDIFHSLRNGEDVAASIELLGPDLWVLHGHGSDRRAPGSPGEVNDWGLTHMALEKVGYTGAKGRSLTIEPFCRKARTDIPPLGLDLPDADETTGYMAATAAFLRSEGFIAAA